MTILAIDPGVTGAVAIMEPSGKLTAVFDLPTQARTSGTGDEIDAHSLASKLRGLIMNRDPDSTFVQVLVERVTAMPPKARGGEARSAGTLSSFNFGETAGVIRGVISSLGLPLRYVPPQTWKKTFGLIGKDKDAARTLAIQQYPDFAGDLARKKDNGRADAILIAAWGVQQLQGEIFG